MRSLRALAALPVGVCLVLSGCAEESGSASGENFPSREMRLLVPYTAGGPTDIAARALATHMEGQLDETIVVENLPGASGATAYQELIAAEADGHTLSMTALPTAVLNYLSNDVGYTREDFVPIGVATQVPSAIFVPANSPYQDVEALFEAARTNPDSVTIATPGATNTHAAETQRITDLYDVPLTVVPFEGGSEVRTALLGGNVTAGFTNVSQDMLPPVESGELRVLAVGSEERLPYVDAPTLAELGYPELTQSTTTFGVIAPSGTPDAVVQQLEDAMRAATEDPEVLEALDPNYVPEEFLGSDDLGELFVATEDTFRDVVGG